MEKVNQKNSVNMTEVDKEKLLLEQRKVKALEKIANTLDALTVWVEEIEKDEWSQRIQYYLAEFHNTIKPKDPTIDG
jgi:hypothetical protein